MKDFKLNRKNMLGVEIICVEGPQGVGKTSFVFSIMSKDYKYHHKTRTRNAEEFTQMLNKKYGYNLSIKNRHLYYSNIPGFLDKQLSVKTWNCDFSKFALPNDNFEVDYFPPYSVIFFTEIDVQAFCRNWHNFSDYYIFLFKYFRHMHYTIIMDLQVFGKLENTLRDLSTKRISMYDSYDFKGILGRKKGRAYNFINVNPQLLEFSRNLRKIEGQLSIGGCDKMRFKYKGNIFKQYNSFSGVPYFLYKIKEWHFQEHELEDLSVAGIEKYCKIIHPLQLPQKKKN